MAFLSHFNMHVVCMPLQLLLIWLLLLLLTYIIIITTTTTIMWVSTVRLKLTVETDKKTLSDQTDD